MLSPKTVARSYWIPVPREAAKFPAAHIDDALLRRLVLSEIAEAKKLYAEYFRT